MSNNWIYWIQGDDGTLHISNQLSDLPRPSQIGVDKPVTAEYGGHKRQVENQ